MQLNDILDRIDKIEDKIDKSELKKEFLIILKGMKEITNGFLNIAESANRIKEKKLYKRIGFNTFEIFCKEIIGITRKQVYLYLRIADVVKKFPEIFNKSRVIMLGTSKMDLLISGINKIENKIIDHNKQILKIEAMTSEVDVKMTVGEIENIVKKYTKNLR